MTYVLNAVRDLPYALFAMDDTSPFQDHSGYGRTATSTSTAATHAALVSGVGYSQIFDTANTITYSLSVFLQGRERHSFSLEAWVKVTSGTGSQQVLGNTGVDDGIWISGNVISFVTKFATAPEARITYDAQMGQTFHVVGVKTSDKASLYVNGKLAQELTLTEEQKADSFVTTPGTMSSGRTTGTQKIALNAVAFYTHEITQEVITRHYREGSRGATPTEVAVSNAGLNIPTTIRNADLFCDFWYITEEDWNKGVLSNVLVLDGMLRPQFEGETSVAGTWTTSVPLSQANTVSIYGVTLDWFGEGAVVKTSLDGNTWTTAVRGIAIPSIPSGFNPTDQVLYIQVSFPGGILNDTSTLDSLNVVGFKTGLPGAVGGRQITLTKAYMKRDYNPLNMNDNWGITMEASPGRVAIGADTSVEAQAVRTLEVWIKRTSATTVTFSIGGTIYHNGATGPANVVQGNWTLVHIVSATDVTTEVAIAGACQIGSINLYSTALSAADVSTIYKQYTGAYIQKVAETNLIGIAEPAQSAVLYAHDWAIQSSG